MKKLGWTEETLRGKTKGDPKKVKIAERLRQQTTMNLEWIAERLRVGTRTHLNHQLYWRQRGKRKK